MNYKGYLIERCSGLNYIPAKDCSKFQITNLNDCDAKMLFVDSIEEAKDIIDELVEGG